MKRFVLNVVNNIKRLPLITVAFSVLFILLLVYTRTVNLGWGLPYPMHPDERNMVIGILTFKCETVKTFECLNPHFFAYGQFPLFVAYFLAKLGQFFSGNVGQTILFEEAVMALRTIAAFCAVFTGIFLYFTFTLLTPLFRKKQLNAKEQKIDTRVRQMISLVIIFVPALIQFSHYGTTESLLMMTFMGIIYFSVAFILKKMSPTLFVIGTGLLTGIALASKVSALPFLGVPGVAVLMYYIPLIISLTKKRKKSKKDIWMAVGGLFSAGIAYTLLSALLGIGLSPFNWLAYSEFMGSMHYETGVGFGDILVFYTRSFFMTTPILFQIQYIFPFVLGLPLFFLSVIGFFFLSWKKKELNFLRYAFLLVFVPQAIVYAKWTRFIAPVYPVMVLFAMMCLYYLYQVASKKWALEKEKYVRWGLMALILIAILPGMAYISVYTKPDVRYVASEWMYKNIPQGSYLLAETANVVDIPAPAPSKVYKGPYPSYTYVSFDSYNLDTNPILGPELAEHIRKADYIIVNSRRVFKNHTCLSANESHYKVPISIDQTIRIPDPFTDQKERCKQLAKTYPQLQKYYQDLFSGKSGFALVAEFTSYPDISLFDVPLIEFPDENAEETWTVFDHPVIRIYKKITP